MPCVAKKGEREAELFYEEYAGHDIDVVITTRELVKMIRSAHISPETLVDVESDRPMQQGSGAGVIFGVTGGVMEAALRTAYYLLKKENPPADAFKAVRSPSFQAGDGVAEADFAIDDVLVKTAVVSGLGNTRKLLEKIERGEAHYDFVEVMACPGGWAETFTGWTKTRQSGFPMKIRIFFKCMKNFLRSRYHIRHICCYIRNMKRRIQRCRGCNIGFRESGLWRLVMV